jgi:membrane protein involved in colicin uptake
MRPGHAIRRPILLLAIVGSLLLAGCNRSSESDIANAKASGAAEEATKQKDQRQADEQARLAAEVKKLQAEAAKKGAATASAAAPAAPAAPAPAAPAARALDIAVVVKSPTRG